MTRTIRRWARRLAMLAVLTIGLSATTGWAEEEAIRGVVAETMNSGGYTYILLDRQGDKQWFAVPESLVKVGDEIQVQPGVQMGSYTSPTLKRTFDKIEFSPGISGVLKRVLTSAGESEAPAEAGVKIAKAEGPNAYTVAEIFAKKAELNGKKVVVRGKVVKVSQFNGLNWLRLIDGSGNSKRGDHKLVVTSSQGAAQDEVVVVSGTVATGKSFGALTYEVIVENATVAKQGK